MWHFLMELDWINDVTGGRRDQEILDVDQNLIVLSNTTVEGTAKT